VRCVSFSRADYLGLAVVEAMAASKPVVVSKKAGVSEIIRNGENGFVFDEPNAVNMALRVEKLIADAGLRLDVGTNAYMYTKDSLSWERYSEKMADVFEEAVNNFRKNR
jgi:glycosyltransferase involved in cell wall biosynthesis